MIALLLAAQVAAAALPPRIEVYRAGPGPVATETPNIAQMANGCTDIRRRVAQRQALAFRKLGELPPARAEYAVMRMVEGCPVPAPVGYHPDYLLPGAADPKR